MCDQVLSGSCDVALSRCSAALPLVVMANRGPDPAFTVRNMFVVVLLPKSNTRDQVLMAAGLTQAAIVKLLIPLTIPAGKVTYSVAPERRRALPIRPVTRGPVAPPLEPTGASAQRLFRIAVLMLLAIVVISLALA